MCKYDHEGDTRACLLHISAPLAAPTYTGDEQRRPRFSIYLLVCTPGSRRALQRQPRAQEQRRRREQHLMVLASSRDGAGKGGSEDYTIDSHRIRVSATQAKVGAIRLLLQ